MRGRKDGLVDGFVVKVRRRLGSIERNYMCLLYLLSVLWVPAPVLGIEDTTMKTLYVTIDGETKGITVDISKDSWTPENVAGEFCAMMFRGDSHYQNCDLRVGTLLADLTGRSMTVDFKGEEDDGVFNCRGNDRDSEDCCEATGPVVNIIQTWKDANIPIDMRPLNQTTQRHMGDRANYIFFTDDDIVRFVRDTFPDIYAAVFVKLRRKIEQIDLFRYLAVYHYGGLYLDLDVALLRPFGCDVETLKRAVFPIEQRCTVPIDVENCHPLIAQHNSIDLGDNKGTALIGQYTFYAPKGHDFIRAILQKIVDRVSGGDYVRVAEKVDENAEEDDTVVVDVLETTGNILVTSVYETYDRKDSISLIEPNPFVAWRFGKYATHLGFGSWKNVKGPGYENRSKPLRV
eukprot:g622.t1